MKWFVAVIACEHAGHRSGAHGVMGVKKGRRTSDRLANGETREGLAWQIQRVVSWWLYDKAFKTEGFLEMVQKVVTWQLPDQ